MTVDLNAHDAGSGVSEMRFSNDGSQWSEWEPYAEQRIWSIPAISGQAWPIYVQVRNGVGLESAVVGEVADARTMHSTNYQIWGGYTAGSQAIPIVRPGKDDSETSPLIPPPPAPIPTPDPEAIKCEFPQISINEGAVFTNQTDILGDFAP